MPVEVANEFEEFDPVVCGKDFSLTVVLGLEGRASGNKEAGKVNDGYCIEETFFCPCWVIGESCRLDKWECNESADALDKGLEWLLFTVDIDGKSDEWLSVWAFGKDSWKEDDGSCKREGSFCLLT